MTLEHDLTEQKDRDDLADAAKHTEKLPRKKNVAQPRNPTEETR